MNKKKKGKKKEKRKMSLHEELNPKQWWSMGNVFKDKLLCQYIRGISSRGFWYGDDPLSYPTPLILVQISLIFFTTRAVFFILQPLRQSMTVAQILVSLFFHYLFFIDHKNVNWFFC